MSSNDSGSNEINRRDFLGFLGSSAAISTGLGGALTLLSSCRTGPTNPSPGSPARPPREYKKLTWAPMSPSAEDQLLLASGLTYSMIAKFRDPIGQNLEFGSHSDFTSFLPLDGKQDEGLLWVNHEYLNPLFSSGLQWRKPGAIRTKTQVDTEMKDVGGSIIHIKKVNQKWELVKDSKHNARFDANTEFDLISESPIANSKKAYGTVANCAGGLTPWNHFLTCEENFDMFFSDLEWKDGKYQQTFPNRDYMWHKYYPRSPFHYGWVVEINPKTKKGKKLTALGRFAHEGATCVLAKDGRTVVYMGDDSQDECIYKFIADKPGTLETGTLYVADTKNGKWLSLTMQSRPEFKKFFKDQTELLINTRVAAHMVGGTKHDRPEDVEINPINNDVIVALTNNKKAGRPHGSLLKIVEKNGDFLSTEFAASTWISGGEDSVLSCPDNMVFDKNGNLWVTTDRSDSEMNEGIYKNHKNNGLYFIPAKGEYAGHIFQVASAPTDAELTGPSFSPDGKTLFLCVQHPGDQSKSMDELTSTWPDGIKNGKPQMPRSAVVAIQGPLLEQLVNS